MYAIINANGRQRRVSPGDIVWLEKCKVNAGETFSIDNVMLLNDGAATMVGAPYIAGAAVEAEVLRHVRDRKVLVFKYKRRKGYVRKNGHRHDYVEARILCIKGSGDSARFSATMENNKRDALVEEALVETLPEPLASESVADETTASE